MIETHDVVAFAPDRVGVLARDVQTRILNCSPTGCLIETNSPIEVGTVGRLQFLIDGREFSDDVQVVRCQGIEGAGSLFQIGVRFLWTLAPGKGSLRYALSQPAIDQVAQLAG
jgi:hypothetical protein